MRTTVRPSPRIIRSVPQLSGTREGAEGRTTRGLLSRPGTSRSIRGSFHWFRNRSIGSRTGPMVGGTAPACGSVGRDGALPTDPHAGAVPPTIGPVLDPIDRLRNQ